MLDWTSIMTIKLVSPAYQRERDMSMAQVEKPILEKWKITIQCRPLHNIVEAENVVHG